MASFYRSTVGEFLAQDEEQVLARLAVAYAERGYTSQYADQTLTWKRDIRSLRTALQECVDNSEFAMSWGLLLEFSIPRKELRIDIVLLVGDLIVAIEAKTAIPSTDARRQIEEYSMLLHYFHKASSDRRIIPVTVSSEVVKPGLPSLDERGQFPQEPTYWVTHAISTSWSGLSNLLNVLGEQTTGQTTAKDWDESPYFPVPTIIEAALRLKSGLSIREIAQSEASEHEIENVMSCVQRYVHLARENGNHAICFLTGVPGSGKTLVGLSLAHSNANKSDHVHFMSGNGPLVAVLQHLFTQESMRAGTLAVEARTQARTLIENVHVFARYYTDDNLGPPSNHAIIFDEAQRAWNRNQNKKKFQRDYSEPEMLLSVMERHPDWAAVIALVGGGQEINDGEAGLEEWGRALANTKKKWLIYASPEVLEGGSSTAGHLLFDDPRTAKLVETNLSLHLRTSNRSLRAEQLATWVNYVLDGDAGAASALHVTDRFPIFLSRSLTETKLKLREQTIGKNRCGLVGSSQAARLRAEGLEPSSSFHADYKWQHWYLSDETDVRSSYRCEVFATEFEIQGLELDWIGLCWGGDFIWDQLIGWHLRTLRPQAPSSWKTIRNQEQRVFRKNAYRVLLTRARQGMVIFVPRGNKLDSTALPAEFDATANYLLRCGVLPLTVLEILEL